MSILAATRWANNSDMITAVRALGYIDDDSETVDLTYGRGTWWKNWRPKILVTNDIDPGYATDTHHDYAALPDWWDSIFDVTMFDPPYVSMGGRGTSKLPEFMARYGLYHAARTPEELHAVNRDGLREAYRITRPGGFVMTKCAPYISSGRYKPADVWMAESAAEFGFDIVDRLIHVGHVRPQPPGRRIVHARNNYSVLWVFQKPRTRKKNR